MIKPWEPVKTEINDNKYAVEVIGRKYYFDHSFLPTAVTVNDTDILAGPVSLNAYFNGVKGVWKEQKQYTVHTSEDEAAFVFSQTAENIIINAHVSVEYDGLIRFSFRVIPFGEFSPNGLAVPKLDKLYIDVPMQKEFATLFHYWPNNNKTSVIPDTETMNSGAMPQNGMSLRFKPYIWCGNEKAGFSFTAETDRNIEIYNPDECIVCQPKSDCLNIRINLLDHMPQQWQGRRDEWVNTLKPLDYEFAFQATPVKPISNNLGDWRVYKTHLDGKFPNELIEKDGRTKLQTIADMGVKWIIFHEKWSVIQNYGVPEDEEKFKKLVQDCHDLGMKVMVYFGYEFSTLHSRWHEDADRFLVKTVNGDYTGGWQRKPWQRAFMVCYKSGYSDMLLKRIETVMDDYGVDGIYTDSAYTPWECANESHGCGVRDANGNLHTKYPVFAVRQFVKKLYEIVHSRGGRIDNHQSACCMMTTLAFCDSYYDGENIQGKVQEEMTDFLSLEAFRTEYMGTNLGIKPQFIAYTNTDCSIEKLSSLTLLHNVHARAERMEDLAYTSAIWKIYDDFGTDDAVWIPYWDEACPVKSLTEKVYCSVFQREEKLLVVVSNLSGKDLTARLSIKGNYTIAQNVRSKMELSMIDSCLEMQAQSYKAEFYIIQ